MKKRLLVLIGFVLGANIAHSQCSPIFTSPSSVVHEFQDNGQCGAFVDFPLPEFTGCPNGVLNLVSGIQSGSLFPQGTTVNTYEVFQSTIHFQEDFSDNVAGWQMDGEWQIGSAIESICSGEGNEDPAVDHTNTADNGIAGASIGGCLSTDLHSYYYLTSPIINTNGATALNLSFWKFLNSDYTPYMNNIVEVFNGSTWVQVWESGPQPSVFDQAWNQLVIDISAYANANMRVRFGYNVDDTDVFVVSGWNLDDLMVYSNPIPTGIIQSLTVNVSNLEPQVSCPGTVFFPDYGSDCGEVITFEDPWVDDCDPYTITQTAGLNSGDFFPIGYNQVVYEIVENTPTYTLFLKEDFSDNSAGWTLDGEWQIGPTSPSSCGISNEDPLFDHSPSEDNGVAGVVLGGCASTAIHPFQYITSPVIDASSASTLFMDIHRWLNSDYTPYMQNVIDVFNGSTWVNIWSTGGSPGIADAQWQLLTYDLTAHANANLRVRFGFNVATGGAFTISQWNLDDIAIYGDAALSTTCSFDLEVGSGIIDATICEGSSYTLGTQTLTIPGFYSEVFTSSGGCDSTIYLNLYTTTVFETFVDTAICEGTSIQFGSQIINTGGNYVEVFPSFNSSCDSIVYMYVYVHPSFDVVINSTTNETQGNDGAIDITVFGSSTYTYSWSNGENTQDIEGLSGGVYTVTVTDDATGCAVTGDITVESEVGIEELNVLQVMVYPNPNDGSFTIQADAGIAQMEIMDNSGRLVRSIAFNGESAVKVDLGEVETGIYRLFIRTKNGTTVNKAVSIR